MKLVELTDDVLRHDTRTGFLRAVDLEPVTVRARGGGLATVYEDEDGTVEITNPVTSDHGRLNGWVEPGQSIDYEVGGEVVHRFEAVHAGAQMLTTARVGGTSDDTDDLNNLHDYAVANGLDLHYKLGRTYNARRGDLKLSSGLRIFSNGAVIKAIPGDSAGCLLENVDTVNGNSDIVVSGLEIVDGALSGDGPNNTSAALRVAVVNGARDPSKFCSRVVFDNLYIHDAFICYQLAQVQRFLVRDVTTFDAARDGGNYVYSNVTGRIINPVAWDLGDDGLGIHSENVRLRARGDMASGGNVVTFYDVTSGSGDLVAAGDGVIVEHGLSGEHLITEVVSVAGSQITLADIATAAVTDVAVSVGTIGHVSRNITVIGGDLGPPRAGTTGGANATVSGVESLRFYGVNMSGGNGGNLLVRNDNRNAARDVWVFGGELSHAGETGPNSQPAVLVSGANTTSSEGGFEGVHGLHLIDVTIKDPRQHGIRLVANPGGDCSNIDIRGGGAEWTFPKFAWQSAASIGIAHSDGNFKGVRVRDYKVVNAPYHGADFGFGVEDLGVERFEAYACGRSTPGHGINSEHVHDQRYSALVLKDDGAGTQQAGLKVAYATGILLVGSGVDADGNVVTRLSLTGGLLGIDSAVTPEIHTITRSGTPITGTFRIRVWNVGVTEATGFTAAEVQTALRALPGLGTVTVALASNVYTVTFPVDGHFSLRIEDNQLVDAGSVAVALTVAVTQHGTLGVERLDIAQDIVGFRPWSGEVVVAGAWTATTLGASTKPPGFLVFRKSTPVVFGVPFPDGKTPRITFGVLAGARPLAQNVTNLGFDLYVEAQGDRGSDNVTVDWVARAPA